MIAEHASVDAIFLMGPTGSGKTAAAIALARSLPVEIVSVDSALVYRGMDIGTAKPNPALLRAVPHHLVDIRDPADPYSAAQFRHDALAAMARIRAGGRVPLLVGGTGLYFRTLEQGIAALPDGDDAVRARLAGELERYGSRFLHAQLAGVDPVAARRIHPNDPQRICRALEVFRLTGRPISRWWAEDRGAGLDGRTLKIVFAPADRSALHQRIAQRFHDMLARGLLNEVRRLYEREDLHIDLPAMRSVGYHQVWRYLNGSIDHDAMVEQAIAATRQLAKRQFTWFRREAECEWLDSDAPRAVGTLAAHLAQAAGLA